MLRLAALVVQGAAAHAHDVVVLGTSADEAIARRCGLRPMGHVSVPGGLPGLAQAATARMVTALGRGGAAPIVVHAWGERAARAAHCSDAAATIMTLARSSVWSATTGFGPFHAACRCPDPVASATIAIGAAVLRAQASHAGGAHGLHGVAPAADPAALPGDLREARRAARARWNAAPDDFVMGLVGDTAPSCHGRIAMYMLALGRVTGRAIRLVMHPSAHEAARLLRFGESLGLRSRVSLDDAILEPWSTAPGLDAALFFTVPSPDGARHASALCLAWTALCGVPIIAEETTTTHEAIEEGRTGFLVPADEHTTAVNRLVRLVDDRALGRRIGEAAREDALERNSPGALLACVAGLYG